MAVKHSFHPFWALQYHPESVMTERAAVQVIRNWGEEVRACSVKMQNQSRWSSSDFVGRQSYRDFIKRNELCHTSLLAKSKLRIVNHLSTTKDVVRRIECETLAQGEVSVPMIVDFLGLHQNEVVVKESVKGGQFSIIGVVDEETTVYEHTAGSDHISMFNARRSNSRKQSLDRYGDNFWTWLSQFMETKKRLPAANGSIPFSGGPMGYFGYEQGLHDIGILTSLEGRPTSVFADVVRSIVFDHHACLIYVQSVNSGDAWVKQTVHDLKSLTCHCSMSRSRINGSILFESSYDNQAGASPPHPLYRKFQEESQRDDILDAYLKHVTVTKPDETVYRAKVRKCQECIRAGDSYELCLTDQTLITIPRRSQPSSDIGWRLYRRLRQRNPAPFGAYLRIGSATIVSCSPERFLTWDRAGVCQLRPIKGTVKKVPGMTFEKASAILGSAKERAENLMIADLIRHDLHGVVGAGNVTVPQLMHVEESETVYHLVSAIQGQLPKPEPVGDGMAPLPLKTGLDILAASLPPGSMTGAPKKRSCEILKVLEEEKSRGIYSGVLGYLSVCGAADFSVVIRTAFRWDNEIKEAEVGDEGKVDCDVWRIGAGGAITALSDDKDEYEEMVAKLDSTIGIFCSERDA
jgi:para-aminobenzoate synthetase